MNRSEPRLPFSCARDGLAATLRGGLLGGYDGAGAWDLVLENVRGGTEQQMVETHEGLHHELQSTTGWGLTAAMALMLSRREHRRYALDELFEAMVETSHETHERFATLCSADVVGWTEARALLRDNGEYLAYLDAGAALAGPGATFEDLRRTAAMTIMRCCMAPGSIAGLIDRGFERISRRDIDFRRDAPDSRLALFEAAGGPASFEELLVDLAHRAEEAQLYDRGSTQRGGMPEDPEAVERFRSFTDDVVVRRCYEHTASVLRAAGAETVPWAATQETATSLVAAVARVDADLASTLNVISERRTPIEDMLELDRQRLRLRARLPVEIVPAGETLGLREAFEVGGPGGDRSVCGVWLSGAVAAKQFAFPADIPVPDHLVSLLVAARTGDGSRVVRLGLLDPSTTPRELQDALGDLPLVVVTTHLTLTDAAMSRQLRRVSPVFVVMDLPVAWHVESWVSQGARISFGMAPLEGSSGDLTLAVFAVDKVPGFRFLSIGGTMAVSLLVERLRQKHPDALTIDARVLSGDGANLASAVSHIMQTWHVLDQDALA